MSMTPRIGEKRNVSVLLLFMPSKWGEVEKFCQPLGILTLGAILKNAGIWVQVIDLSAEGWSKKQLIKKMCNHNFTHVGITLLTPTRKIGYEIFKTCKILNPDITTIAGGPHVTLVKEDIFKESGDIDIAVSGEAELEIVEIIMNPTKRFYDLGYVKDIDNLPIPDRTFVRHIKYNKMSGISIGDSASMKWIRGCQWRKCTFCSRSEITMAHRRRSPEKIIEEIDILQNKMKYKNLIVVDDSLRINCEYTKRILKLKIDKKLDIPFWALARADHIDEEGAALLKEANCVGILLGIESIVPRIIDRYKKTNEPPEQWHNIIEKSFKILNKHNIISIGSLIIGGPDETKEEILETVEFCKNSNLDVAEAFPFQFIIGSKLWSEAISENKISSSQYYSYNDRSFGTTSFTTQELFKMAKYAEKRINSPLLNPGRILRLFKKLVKNRQWRMLIYNLIKLPLVLKSVFFNHPYELIPEDLHG